MVRQTSASPVHPTQSVPVNHRRSPEHSIRHTYAQWMRRFPRWVNAGFNEDFLLQDALPQLHAMLAGGCYLSPTQLAQTWVTAFGVPQQHMRRAVAECTLVAADFLMRLQINYCAQPA